MSAEVTPLRAVTNPPPAVREKFIAGDYAQELAAMEPYATGGSQIYVFLDGHYKAGERHLQRRVIDLLGDSWSKRKAEEITAYLRITSPDLWPQPPIDVINVTNGLLNTRTRKLVPHTPLHLSPVQVAAAYNPDAASPAVDAFLETTIPTLIPLFEEIVGYVITPDNRRQKAVMLIGAGGTGKSTAANLIRALLGPENVASVALHQLEDDRFATADLYGRLANIFADLDARALRSSSIFKSITGGDRIRAERKHRDSFEFTPYAPLIFSANEAPPTADNSDAFFERWLILPFDRKHRGARHQDHDLHAKLTTPTELSGLLNRALNGLQRLNAQQRFTSAPTSDAAAERFRIDADSAAGFLEDDCTLTPDSRTAKPDLYRAYAAWCENNGRRPLAAQRFNRRLRELHTTHLDEIASEGRDYWLGIHLKDTP
jgi:putative DNA primase/helicase